MNYTSERFRLFEGTQELTDDGAFINASINKNGTIQKENYKFTLKDILNKNTINASRYYSYIFKTLDDGKYMTKVSPGDNRNILCLYENDSSPVTSFSDNGCIDLNSIDSEKADTELFPLDMIKISSEKAAFLLKQRYFAEDNTYKHRYLIAEYDMNSNEILSVNNISEYISVRHQDTGDIDSLLSCEQNIGGLITKRKVFFCNYSYLNITKFNLFNLSI